MKCSICGTAGPFTLEACVIDEKRPICDKCANALDNISDADGQTGEWETSFKWILENSKRIQDKEVSDFIADIIGTAKDSQQYVNAQNMARVVAARAHDKEVAPYNPVYEYAVEAITDNVDGSANTGAIELVLTEYATHGWRLHQTIVNEIGKESQSYEFLGIARGSNATIEQTVLIFERIVKPAEKKD